MKWNFGLIICEKWKSARNFARESKKILLHHSTASSPFKPRLVRWWKLSGKKVGFRIGVRGYLIILFFLSRKSKAFIYNKDKVQEIDCKQYNTKTPTPNRIAKTLCWSNHNFRKDYQAVVAFARARYCRKDYLFRYSPVIGTHTRVRHMHERILTVNFNKSTVRILHSSTGEREYLTSGPLKMLVTVKMQRLFIWRTRVCVLIAFLL